MHDIDDIEQYINDSSEMQMEMLAAERRHNELLSILKAFFETINSDKKTKEIISFLNKNNSHFQAIADKIKELSIPPQKPSDIIVVANQDVVVKELKVLAENISKNGTEIKNFLSNEKVVKEWEFRVQRDYQGLIEKVIAKPKIK